MRYGFVIPGGDVLELMDLSVEIESAGWDGVFIADGVYSTDPWVSLAGIATRTHRVRIGTLLTPPSRRRPWKLAGEVATLDRLSGGRVILPVGLGATDTGFDKGGEVTERRARAQLLDESLCGPYEVRDRTVVHRVELSLFPNWVGTEQERFCELEGDRLGLSTGPMILGGNERRAHLIWERVPPT